MQTRVDNNKKIKASVIIPTYNRSKSLKRALISLNRVNYPKGEWEIVVVDNNSNGLIKSLSALDWYWYLVDSRLIAYFNSDGGRRGYVISVSGLGSNAEAGT